MSVCSSCEASDALVKLGFPSGGTLSGILPFSPKNATRIAGPVYTVKFVYTADKNAPILEQHFVDTAPANSIILIDCPPTTNAVWGGLMTAGALARGVKGVVISGRCRDLVEHREQNFPVYASGRSTAGQSPLTRPSQINVPLTVSGVTISPGDWIIADEDGVVCVPHHVKGKVLELAARAREVDEKCMQDIKAGLGIQASFRKHRGKL